jgi:hypothetical protein
VQNPTSKPRDHLRACRGKISNNPESLRIQSVNRVFALTLTTDVLFGKGKMTRARWNNVLAPVLLPLVSARLGPMTYCMITATKC